MARLPNFLVIIRSEKLSGKGQGRGVGVRKKERFVLGKRTFRSQKSKHFVLRIIYIGFPAENPGPGAAYDRMFPFIFQKGAAVEMAIGTFAAYDEIYTGKIGSNSNWTMGTAIDVLKSSELENLAAATANALSGVTADREVLRSSVFDYDQRKVGSSYYVGYYDFVEMMEKLVVDEVALDEWKQAYDAASVCWKKTPMIYSMSVGMFSMKRANGVSHYIPSTATSAAAQAANAAYRSTLWYSAVGLARLGW